MANVVSNERYYCNFCLLAKPATDFSEAARAQAIADDENAACLDCIDKMQRSRIGRNEVDAYLQQDLDKRNRRYRIPGQADRKDTNRRIGRTMHSSELILRLRRLIPNLVLMEGYKRAIALYRAFGDQLTYLGWTHQGTLPEYSITVTNDKNLPIREKRGWRTVLLRLIKAGVITEEQVTKQFGHPTNGEQARFYLDELYCLRNRRYLQPQRID